MEDVSTGEGVAHQPRPDFVFKSEKRPAAQNKKKTKTDEVKAKGEKIYIYGTIETGFGKTSKMLFERTTGYQGDWKIK